MHKFHFLLLLAVAALGLPTFSAAAGLEGVEWTLTEVNGKPFVATAGGRGAPTLHLDAEKKKASGFSGVNRYFGGYKLDGAKLKFGQLASTMMAGPPEAMATESTIHAMLASVTGWRIADGALALLHDDKVVARFASRPVAEK